MIEQAAKILVGTGFYLILLLVAERNPRAAGIMLTFPALNGIVLLMAEPASIGEIASSVMLMPVLNAIMWASYLSGFDRLVRNGVAPAKVSWLLMGGGAGVWLLAGMAITSGQWGVPAGMQSAYWLAALLVGLALTAAQGLSGIRLASPLAPRPLGALLARHRVRIVLFVLTLLTIALAERLGGSTALLGVLAGLPLIAMFGLHSLACDATIPLASRLEAMAGMARGVWLGPVVAILFVACVWRALVWLAGTISGIAYLLCGAMLLVLAWSLSLLAVWVLAGLIVRPSAARP